MGIDNGGTTIPDRLDAALVALGLVESRAKAQRLIKSGKVMVDGVTATKPAQTIASASDIAIDKGDDYVSRGAYKLVGAFDAFRAAGLPEPVGFDCLDIGASTGGFCDVLLRARRAPRRRPRRRPRAARSAHRGRSAHHRDERRQHPRRAGRRSALPSADGGLRRLVHLVDVCHPGDRTHRRPRRAYRAPGQAAVRGRQGASGQRAASSRTPHCASGRWRPSPHAPTNADWTSSPRAPSPIEGTHGNAEYLLYARAAER